MKRKCKEYLTPSLPASAHPYRVLKMHANIYIHNQEQIIAAVFYT